MHLLMSEIVRAVSGHVLNPASQDIVVTSICTDTRKLVADCLYVPLVGDRFDGHDFIAQAIQAGAVCVLTERDGVPAGVDRPLIRVSSTRQALMDLAAYYRRLHDIPVVAITGSAGKTTTKEMIAHILARRFKTQKTMGNFNNDIGLPLSIFQLDSTDEALVLEMGMNHANEITHLSRVGAPDIAVITHIGDAHIENFANREGILHAKLEIVDGLKPGGTVILNGDDPLLTGAIARAKTRPFVVKYYGAENIISSEPLGLTATRCHFRIADHDIHCTIPLPGRHMFMNALLAAAVGVALGLTAEEIAAGLTHMQPPDGRLSIETLRGMTVINDAYNANPASMQEAIKVLTQPAESDTHARTVCILGDMAELGQVSEARHREVGAFAAQAGIDLLIAIGSMSHWLYDTYQSQTNAPAVYYATLADFLPHIDATLQPSDRILIKASRSMALEQIINTLY